MNLYYEIYIKFQRLNVPTHDKQHRAGNGLVLSVNRPLIWLVLTVELQILMSLGCNMVNSLRPSDAYIRR